MNIETLKMFKDLIDTQNFTKTAELNFVTQSAVSQHMKKLEIIFKTKLFLKKNEKLELTEIGKIVYQYSSDIVSKYSEMLEKVNLNFNRSILGEVRISSIYSVGIYYLRNYIREFISLNPNIKISLNYMEWDEVIEKVIKGDADFGFLACKSVNDHNLSSIPVADEELVLVAPVSFKIGEKNQVPLSYISSLKLVFFEKNTPSRKFIDNILKKSNVKLNITMELNNIDTIKAAVMSNTGFSILPLNSVIEDEKNSRLKFYRFTTPLYRPVYMIYCKRKKFSKEVNRFLNFILSKKKEKNYNE
ncbi:MAG: LysR family transcriptional regulator [Elusimicrobiales bacterium]|nr:LysR family transcriptional regulator [Elusimicrobiales bacterium]